MANPAGKRPGESEYGGKGGIIQSHEDHRLAYDQMSDNRAVQENAMVLRTALKKEAGGILVSKTEVRNDDGSITVTDVHHDEASARAELEESK